MTDEFDAAEEYSKPRQDLVEQIVEESRERDKKRDESVLDEGLVKRDDDEIVKLIESYKDKSDLAEKFLEICPLYYDTAGLWWKWKRYRWEITDEVDILNLVQGSSSANIVFAKERNEIINAVKQSARRKRPKTPEKTWLQFNDEIVDLKTGERFKATPKYFVTNPIPYDIGKSDETPNMDKIFEEWVGKKYTKTLYEIIAYCLLPDYPINRLFCFVGAGLNGKSKFLELLRKFVGKSNICSTELDTLIMSRFEITRLHKKLVCQMGETNFNEMSKTSVIKKLTGGDLIGFEYKNKNPFEEVNYAKILIATNNLPTTTDKTIGFYRRWCIIDFPNQFDEKKDILDDVPHAEYENLAMKCVGLLIELMKKKEFHNEGDIEERMARYEARSDFLQKFLDEFTEEKIDAFITKADFRKKFADWCKEHRHREMADNTLSKALGKKGIQPGRKYVDWMYDGKGGQMKIYLDIKWKD